MDPERQPLLGQGSQVRRRFRPLTPEEVLTARQELTWRRARFFLVVMFWGIMAMFLSIITCILMTAPRCSSDAGVQQFPSVPPVHMTFAPLISRMNEDRVYAL
ncbi:uncharacterized protein LOC113504774 [Trichoplusia ni]|uniref:Uncharacterized protein LOC113504774 n=1 Tax=Trichoplusia ni TaxID=7111 RepID=A0A7E5WQT7_TRINI|nr:uncharacterized protein LOC113504774 [Trichoplusia ni]